MRGCETVDDLAVFGGTPAFAQPLHVGRPNLGDRTRFLKRINGALDRHWLTNGGELVEEFERRIAELAGVEHCVAVCNATIGIQIAAKALGLSGEVITPSFTFIGSAHALSWIGIEPVFCDVDTRTHLLDPASVEGAITPRTSAILGIHLWGRPCDVDALSKVARRHNLALFFDAAHALGCARGPTPVGALGECEVFSFHATKVASSAEGGAITTNNAKLADRLRLLRNFGFAGYDTVVALGTNGKMSELSAALGISTLEQLDHFIDRNRRNHQAYKRHFSDIPGLHLNERADGGRHNFQYVVFEVDPEVVSRDDLVSVLHAENVLARRYFSPGCHRLAPYADTAHDLPITERLAATVMAMPTGGSVSEDDIATIAQRVRVAASHGAELRARLSASSWIETSSATVTRVKKSRQDRELRDAAFRDEVSATLAELRAMLQTNQSVQAQLDQRLASLEQVAGERQAAVAAHLHDLSDLLTRSLADVAAHLAGVDQRLASSVGELLAAHTLGHVANAKFHEISAERFIALAEHLRVLGEMIGGDLTTRIDAVDQRVQANQGLTARVYELQHNWRAGMEAIHADPEYQLAFDEPRPLVSVYICTWNRAELLIERALASVLRQTYDNWEAIIIGDACTDDTEARIAAIKDPRISFENLKVRGPYPEAPAQLWQVAGIPGSHLAFQRAKGRWTAQLDDDDEWDDDHLEVLLAEAVRTRADIVYGKWRLIDAKSGEPLGRFGTWPPQKGEITLQAAIEHGYLRRFRYDLNTYLADEPGDWNRMRRLQDAGTRFAFVDREVATLHVSAKTEEIQRTIDMLRRAEKVRKPN